MLVRRKHQKEDSSNSVQDVLLYATVQRCQWLQRGVVQVHAMSLRCKPHQRDTGSARVLSLAQNLCPLAVVTVKNQLL
jgi:hypothetical protein